MAGATSPASVSQVRVLPAMLLAAGMAVLMAWSLGNRAVPAGSGSLPPGSVTAGHGHGPGLRPPPSITAEPELHYLGVTVLALHLAAGCVFGGAAAVRGILRRLGRAADGVASRVVFSALSAAGAALGTVLMSGLAFGSAISFASSLAAAVLVLQFGFVGAVAGSALLGVP